MTKIAQVVTMPLFSSLHQGPPYLVDIHVTLRPTTRLKHDKREVINELERDDLYIPYHTSRAGRRKAHNIPTVHVTKDRQSPNIRKTR
jgi:hypothetical protein